MSDFLLGVMDGSTVAGLVIVGLIVLLVVVILAKGFMIVQQAEVVIIERLGRYKKTLQSGVNIIIPMFEKPRSIHWRYIEADFRNPAHKVVAYKYTNRIDLREMVYDFPSQNVITRDNVTLTINALIYFQITDPFRAVYEIQNLPDAIEKLTQTTLRNVLGELDLDQTLTSRDTINSKLRGILDEASDKWGVRVNRVELQDIDPPRSILEDMEKQMRAERERRAQVLQAEGEKAAKILRAEGERQSRINLAEGERQSQILLADGEAEAKLRIAQAEAASVKVIAESVGMKSDPVAFMVAMKYLETLTAIGQSPQKTVFLPYEAAGVMGSIGSMKKLFEGEASTGVPPVLKR